MLIETLPIEVFITSVFKERDVNKFVAGSHLEIEELRELVALRFRDMGMTCIQPTLEAWGRGQIKHLLKQDPVIRRRIAEEQNIIIQRRIKTHGS